MNSRSFFIVICTVACLAALTCVLIQGRQIASLRTQRQELVSDARPAESISNQAILTQWPPQSAEQRPASSPSLELLRLRSEVTRLTTRRRELLGVTNESALLRAQFRERKTNAPAGSALPPGYILRSKAKRVGFNTPDDTMQSFLWAMQNRDIISLLQALTPDWSGQIETQLRKGGNSTNDFFQRTEAWVGMAILDRQQLPDGSIEARIQLVPGIPSSKFRFQLIDGLWKMGPPR